MTSHSFYGLALALGILFWLPFSLHLRTVAVPRLTKLLFTVLAVSITAFLASRLFLNQEPVFSILTVLGGASCGLSWLLIRSLFHGGREPIAIWCWVVVGLIVASHVLVEALYWWTPSGALRSELLRTMRNVNVLSSSVALLLGLVEPLSNEFSQQTAQEQRFRLCFATGYGLLMGISVLWVGGASEEDMVAVLADPIRVVCALLAVAGCAAAIVYRGSHLLQRRPRRKAKDSAATVAERELAERILTLVSTSECFTEPDLKVDDLAERLDVQPYLLSQAITGALAYQNFNQMINQFRIGRAQQLLADPRNQESILNIALRSGFNSIGPFNRAFKAVCAQTPSQYRREQKLIGAPLQ
ncbi:MAG: helix-turn-helix transcriptional regulator [Pseudomonadota bacterium]